MAPSGRIWIQTDVSTSTINAGAYAGFGYNQMPCTDPLSRETRRFLVGPKQCEITGVCVTPDERSMFVGIQHPGERRDNQPGNPANPVVKLFWEIRSILAASEIKEAFGQTVTNLLTFFIILEIFKRLVEYFREHRLKLTFIVDATLVFILREVMIGLYQHQSSPLHICPLTLLMLALGAVRTLAIVYSPMERKLAEACADDTGKNPFARSTGDV